MNSTLTRFLTCIFLIIISCDFKPEEEIFTELQIPSGEGMSINLNNFPDQEIPLAGETLFRYAVETNGKELIESRAVVNGSTVWNTTEPEGAFTLDPQTLGTGTHTLRIEFTAKSETGSIAEQYGVEAIYVWIERTILVDLNIPQNPDDPDAIAITAVHVVDNIFEVEWSAYEKINFQGYQLIRRDYDNNGVNINDFEFPYQTQASATTGIDNTYMGGKSTYHLILHAADQTYEAPPFAFEYAYSSDIKKTFHPNGSVTLSWNSLKALGQNCRGYKVEIRDVGPAFPTTQTFNLNTVLDTTLTFTPSNFLFGATKALKLTHINGSEGYSKVYSMSLVRGNTFPAFGQGNEDVLFVEETGTYYLVHNTKLHKIAADGTLIDSVDNYYPFLQLNKTTGIASDMNSNIYKINLETMNVESLGIQGNVIDLSEDNRILLAKDGMFKILTFDGTELFSMSILPNSTVCTISPDGKFVQIRNAIFKLNAVGEYEHWGNTNTFHLLTASYSENQPGKVIFGFQEKITVFNLETMTEEFATTAYKGACNIDNTTNLIGCDMTTGFVILNQQLQLQKTLATDQMSSLFYLLNNSIICTSGAQIDYSDIP